MPRTSLKSPSTSPSHDLSWVLHGLHMTEKAAQASTLNAYTFKVAPDANKLQIADAVKHYYKVIPTHVRVINQQTRPALVRGRRGSEKGHKKALVFLKKGDTITFV